MTENTYIEDPNFTYGLFEDENGQQIILCTGFEGSDVSTDTNSAG